MADRRIPNEKPTPLSTRYRNSPVVSMTVKRRLCGGALPFVVAWLLLAGVMLALPAGAGPSRHVPEAPSSALQSSAVVINEVAWGGTAASTDDEWIELYNRGDVTVDLTDWVLAAVDGTPVITISGAILPHATFLLERKDDETVSDILADQIYDGILEDGGEQLELRDAAGHLVDSANCDGGNWAAGSASPYYFSMERVNPFLPDSADNWQSNDGVIRNGVDADVNPINGTPTMWNSTGVTADVGIVKIGPTVGLPGAEITFTLTLSNSGELTATAVLVTDTLPPNVSYLHSTVAYPLIRPEDGILVWQVGAVPPGSGPISFSFTGQLTDVMVIGEITNTAQIATLAIERNLDDNRTQWVTWVDAASLFTDLVVGKSGPLQVAAGALITYTISLGNSGGLTATGVVLTDVLPAGVNLSSQSSSFTLTQPVTGSLVWEIGALPPASPPLTWTVVGLVADGTAGPLTNTVSVTSAVPEANPADNRAGMTTMAFYTPTVRLTAVHYDALQGDDEAVQIANLGNAPAEIGGWTLTDNEYKYKATLPLSATLAAGESIWITRDAVDFYMQFGFAPDFEKNGSDPAVPDLAGSWPALANDGDEVVLLDADGAVRDVLVYRGGNIHLDGWNGPAVYPYHPGALSENGQILYRKLDQATGRPVPDSDTAADWAQETTDLVNGRKVRYPGWDLEYFFHTTRLTQTAHLTVAIGPDALYPVIVAEINAATRTLQIQSYTFENTALAEAVAARAAAGVSVTILLDGSPAGGLSDQGKWACWEIENSGGRCYFSISDSSRDIRQRYAHQDAKYIIVDGMRALIGSENLGMESMPSDDKGNGTAGRRGVYLITDAPGVVAHLETLFALDMDPTMHQDIATMDFIDPPPAGYLPITTTDWTSYTAYYSIPLALQGEFAFEIIQSPENSLRDSDSLLGLLARVGEGDTVLVEQMDEPLYWGDGESNPDDDPNLRVVAYIAAAQRGAAVRVLLDSYFDQPADPRGNWATCAYLRQVAQEERLQLACQLGNPTALGIHNNMVLVQIGGRGYLHVGSINGSEIASKGNREVALQVQSDEAYAYLARIFERDWRHLVCLPIVLHDYGPADHLLLSEVLYDPLGTDSNREWVELYNPTDAAVPLVGWMLGDAVYPDDGEGMYLFPGGAVLSAYQTLVIAVRGDLFFEEYAYHADYELLSTSSTVPDLARHPAWGTGYLALANDGDELLLLDSAGRPVDVLVWGSGSFPGVLPHPGVELDGHSLERYPPWLDRDDCSRDFRDWPDPNPGHVP